MSTTKSGQEKPSEKLVEESMKGLIENSVEVPVVESAKNPMDKSIENSIGEIKGKSIEDLVVESNEMTIEEVVKKPIEELAKEIKEKPVEMLVEDPIEKSLGNLVEKPIEESSEKLLEEVNENTVEEITEKPIEGVVENSEEALGEITEKPIEESTEKLIKRRKKIVIGTIISLSTLLIFYLGMAKYFSNHFYFGSEINSINVSGKTVEDAKMLVASQIPNYSLTLKERDGKSEQIKGSDLDLKSNSDEEVSKLKDSQSPFKWVSAIFSSKDSKMTIGLSYNEDLLKEQVDKLSCVNDKNVVEPKNASFQYKDSGYVVVEAVPGTKLDKAVLYSQVASSISKGQNELDLESAGAYISPKHDSKSDKVASVKDTLEKYASANITYTFGDKKETIDGSVISKWLKVDDDFNVTLDSEKIKAYLLDLSKTYDTVGKSRKFVTTSGSTINLDGGDYGWSIDSDKETQNLIKDITDSKTVTREPLYEQTAFSESGNSAYSTDDIGKTYVEVSLSSQHLWFYKNGSLVVQGDIVSGTMSNGHATPKGIYKLKYKERNAILRGPGYATRVSFWMPFNQDIGIHDATWRSSFGGTIYYSSGSHGCLNSPYSLANTIFDNIDPGTPVVCYY